MLFDHTSLYTHHYDTGIVCIPPTMYIVLVLMTVAMVVPPKLYNVPKQVGNNYTGNGHFSTKQTKKVVWYKAAV